ncbi:hypothetical protein EII29_02440 [Leptotrichia sp. OH3620_COT-345]|uniref:hypothetical protein n=1 Tax=Leptotrichia sp. OH3620_COT-345 TaxID=2491048 RepID=UPI000F645A73|nr:hypothetical protein [Leptotrichia sp. OH3620_COT-345]RRD40357.1 hypothetical protein EII29_02440 [Leptotrichia sp. OH3620_COT-345]
MKRIIIFLLLILGIFSCNDPTKEIKKDLAELKAALEEINKEYEPILDRVVEFHKEELNADIMKRTTFVGDKESDEVIAKREAFKKEIFEKTKNEIDSMKFPKTEKVKKIIEKLEKKVSKRKVNEKNIMEISYYNGLSAIMSEVKVRIERIDNFKNNIIDYNSLDRISSGMAQLDYRLDNTISQIIELENFPI